MLINKNLLFWLIFVVIISTSLFVLFFLKKPDYVYKQGSSTEADDAVTAARDLYRVRVVDGIDLSSGPCLSNDIRPGWVVDIVHNPRESADDLVANQCPAYIEGRAKHFIELDNQGKIIRVK